MRIWVKEKQDGHVMGFFGQEVLMSYSAVPKKKSAKKNGLIMLTTLMITMGGTLPLPLSPFH